MEAVNVKEPKKNVALFEVAPLSYTGPKTPRIEAYYLGPSNYRVSKNNDIRLVFQQ